MPLKLKREGSTWWIDGQVNGHRVRKSCKTEDKATANKMRSQIEHRILVEGSPLEADAPVMVTLGQAAEHYAKHKGDGLTKGQVDYVNRILSRGGSRTLVTDIDQVWVDDYVDTHLSGRKSGTVRRELAVLIAILNHATKRGWCEKPTIDRPSDGPPRERFLSQDEAKKLTDAMYAEGAWMHSLVSFLLNTGARLGEATALTYADLTANKVKLTTRKGRSNTPVSRWVPLNGKAHTAVLQAMKHFTKTNGRPPGGSDPVFTAAKGQKIASRSHLEERFAKVCSLVDIRDFRIHDLRHTFASQLVINGVRLEVVSDLLGHESINTTKKVYAKLAPRNLEDAVAVLDTMGA